jgi:hypothetical protein
MKTQKVGDEMSPEAIAPLHSPDKITVLHMCVCVCVCVYLYVCGGVVRGAELD